MPKTNPFNITFGKVPLNKINRDFELDEINESFSNENPAFELCFLTGPRGCGKTVALTTLCEHYENEKDFIVVELNPEMDMLEQLASKLIDAGKLKKLFVKAEFNFSFHGLSFSIKGDEPITHISTLLDRIFLYLKDKGLKVLISIDEVTSNSYMKIFAHEFQNLIRKKYDLFLLMTGLYENISSLENEKSLTFLYRAPKIYLSPLSLRSITTSYQSIFNLSKDQAMKLAKLTDGYAFAYQLLEYILFKNEKTEADQEILDEFDDYLENRVYAKIWESISKREKEILNLVSIGKNTNQEVIKALDITSNSLSVYKKKLELIGILDNKERGVLKIKLPRFSNFIKYTTEFDK